jgi:glycosyltransferase involved in cell wall biosynthesis
LTLISVCMAVRNGEATIAHAIRSIILQTWTDWELILVDDASNDQTLRVIGEFADPRIRLVRNPIGVGLATSLNRAISEARGQYIARMDADDVSFPDRFERQLRFLEQHPEIDLVAGQAVMFQGDWALAGQMRAPLDHARITRSPGRSFPLFHPCWMGKAEWFARYRYDEQFLRSQDFELLLRALPHSTYANVPDVILGYRYERQNLARRRVSRRYQRLAVAKNRPCLPTGYTMTMSALCAKDVADVILFWVGVELSVNSRTAPSPALARQWSDLVKLLG